MTKVQARQDGTAEVPQAAEIDRKLRALVRTLAQMAAEADYKEHQKQAAAHPKGSET